MSAYPPRPPLPDEPPADPTRPLRAPVMPRAPVPPQSGDRVVERVPPPYPVEASWWGDNPWPAIVLAVIGLIVGGLLGYIVGHEGETSARSSNRAQQGIAHTVTRSSTVVQPKIVERTVTTPSPTNAANEERRLEAESDLRKAERENGRLKQELESNERG